MKDRCGRGPSLIGTWKEVELVEKEKRKRKKEEKCWCDGGQREREGRTTYLEPFESRRDKWAVFL